MSSSASTDTFPADVAEVRRAAGITIAPEAALHRALQERTDELERVRAELHDTLTRMQRDDDRARQREAGLALELAQAVRERDEALAHLLDASYTIDRLTPPTAPDVGSTTSAPAAGAADPRRGRTPDEIRAWAAGLFGG